MRCPVCGNLNREGARFCDSCGSPLQERGAGPGPELPEGAPSEIAGRYEVVGFLGRGGRKSVYRVLDREADGRELAISVFETAGIGETAMARARREAQAMERLGSHPRIAAVLSSGEHEGAPFLVSEYMPGGDVGTLLAGSESGRLEPARAIAIAIDICRALEHAHGHAIVHRDIKPVNVWIDEQGRARLGDFGLATTERRSREAAEGSLIGTVAYLPPEQALGRKVDARADLYSLGALLYEMVAGQPPFSGDDAVAVISRHINAAPVPPRRLEPSLPVALDRLIIRLLAKAPDDRPPSAAAARAELEEIAANPDAADEQVDEDAIEDLAGGAIVGRSEELAEMQKAVADALRGRGNMVFLVGEPGIGKTRTAEELATWARVRGARVLWGHCHEGERAPAFWPWTEAIREFVREADPVGLRWQLGSRGRELARLVPEIAELLGTPGETPQDEHGRFRLFDAVAGFLVDASRSRPLVILLEDLHWADASSLELLRFTARQFADSGLLIVGTYRDFELGQRHAVSEMFAELAASDRERTLRLRGLDQAGVAEMIEATTGVAPSTTLVRAIRERTEGNPFFVGEVVRLLAGEGELGGDTAELPPAVPRGARDAIARRLEDLSETAVEILAIAAVAGRIFEPAIVEDVSGRDAGEVAAALSQALEAKLVVTRPASELLAFGHAIVRETIYASIEPRARADLHGRVGEAIERLHPDDRSLYLDDLARHFVEACESNPEKAIEYSRRAARGAAEKLAHEDAAIHYARALALLADTQPDERRGRLQLELALGQARTLAGRLAEARGSLEDAAALARELGDYEALARAGLAIALVAVAGNVDEPLLALLEEALAATPDADSVLRVELLSALSARLVWQDPQGAAAAAGREAVAMADRLGDDHALAVALFAQQMMLSGQPDSPRRRLENVERLIRVAGRCDDGDLVVRGHAHKLHALLELGEIEQARVAYADYARLARELRQPQHLWHLPLFRSVLATMEGRFDDAAELAEEAYRGGERAQEPLAGQFRAAQMAVIRQQQGRLEEALPAVREMARRFSVIRAWQLTVAGFLAELGNSDEARTAFERFSANDYEDLPRDMQWLPAMVRLADACHWLDDRSRAEVLYAKLEPFSGLAVVIGRAATCLGPVDIFLGRLALTRQRPDQAAAHFDAALALARKMDDRPSTLEARYGLGRALAARGRTGDRERGLEELAASLDGAEALGMRRLVERAIATRLEVQGLADIDVLSSIDAVIEAVGSERPDLSALAAGDGSVTILFSDIENSTLINERLGDERWLEILREHNAVFRRRLDDHGGYEVKSQGDGFMLAFGDPAAALRFAVDVQRELAVAGPTAAEGIRVRMGLHSGEAIAEEGDLFGRSVVLAARIAAQAVGGEILVSEALEAGCGNADEGSFSFGEPRELELKGLAGTHRVFRVLDDSAVVA